MTQESNPPQVAPLPASNWNAEPIAFSVNRWLPLAELAIPAWDLGFAQGVMVAEQLRTWHQQPWLVTEHLQRLQRSLELAKIPAPREWSLLPELIEQIVVHHRRLLAPERELNILLAISGGELTWQSPRAWESESQLVATVASTVDRASDDTMARIYLSCVPLRTPLWQTHYASGVRLVTSPIAEIESTSLPRPIKHRNRLHYWIANQLAAAADGQGAIPLFQDREGRLLETPTAALLIYRRRTQEFIVPPADDVLPSITLSYLKKLIAHHHGPVVEQPLHRAEIVSGDEVFLVSTPFVLWTVTQWDGQLLNSGQPGAMYHQLWQWIRDERQSHEGPARGYKAPAL